jgi:hypothetical protein
MGGEQLDQLYHALSVFASAFFVSAFAGLATLLRFAKKLSKLAVVSALLNSGFLGLAIALLWYQNYRKEENVYSLIGFCVLAGMGGSSLTDLVFSLLAGAGIRVIITREEDTTRNGDNKNDPTRS